MRVMRMLVMFDLPTGSKSERKKYSEFRKFLIQDGYVMEQFSVYSRVLLSRDSGEAHMKRLKENLPPSGAVTVLTLTEKQFEDRAVLIESHPQVCARTKDPGPQMTLSF